MATPPLPAGRRPGLSKGEVGVGRQGVCDALGPERAACVGGGGEGWGSPKYDIGTHRATWWGGPGRGTTISLPKCLCFLGRDTGNRMAALHGREGKQR